MGAKLLQTIEKRKSRRRDSYDGVLGSPLFPNAAMATPHEQATNFWGVKRFASREPRRRK